MYSIESNPRIDNEKKKSTLCNFDQKSQKIRRRRRRRRTLIFWNKVLIQPSDAICLVLMAVISTQRWKSMVPSFYFRPDSVRMAPWRDWFLVLGFGEGEGREIDKREERQGFAFWRKKKAGFVFIRFWKRFFCFFFFFLNIVLMLKIVGVSEASVMYIYIYVYICIYILVGLTVKWEKEIRIYGTLGVLNNYPQYGTLTIRLVVEIIVRKLHVALREESFASLVPRVVSLMV